MHKQLLLIYLIFSNSASIAQSDVNKNHFVINFGSCNKEDQPQPLWDEIMNNKPDLWIWLGDNVYGDTDNKEILKQKYRKQKNIKEYQSLKKEVKVIGTWDDHDFGINDGNKNYHFKEDSKQLFFDFLDEPKDSQKRKNAGVYSSYNFNIGEEVFIKVILLDVRYNQDEIKRINGICQPNFEGDILGRQQWKWFENELENNKASMTIIGSGLQIIPADHNDEKWANFPRSRQRIFNLLQKHKTPGVFFLSGDRHMAEVSKIKLNQLNYEIHEITSSGMTHSWQTLKEDYNRHRVSGIVPFLNYGQLKLFKQENTIKTVMSINGDNGITYWSETVQFPIIKLKN